MITLCSLITMDQRDFEDNVCRNGKFGLISPLCHEQLHVFCQILMNSIVLIFFSLDFPGHCLVQFLFN